MKEKFIDKRDSDIKRILDIFESKDNDNYLSLYFHIPFCAQRCDYCNYVSSEKKEDLIKPYVESIVQEINNNSDILKSKLIRSIYFGGGTPSFISANFIAEILNTVRAHNNFSKDVEITVEINPESVTLEKLSIYKQAGVNRISVGLQCYNEKVLKLVNRITTLNMFDTAMKNIKEAGFKNINVDIMIGLPGQTLKDVKLTLKQILSYDVTHVSLYSLILEPKTKLYENVENKLITLPSENMVIKAYKIAAKTLAKNGFYFYEIGNFAKAGHESLHNINYWFHGNFFGFGVGAFGMIDSYDYETKNDLEGYCNKSAFAEKTIKAIDHIQIEKIMLGLRTIYGIPLSLIKSNKLNDLKLLIKEKFLFLKNGRLVATEKGFIFLNYVLLKLI